MDEPHVQHLIRRSAEYGGRVGPVALAAGAGGFLVWLIALDASPAIREVGWLVGLCGMLVALPAAFASALRLRDGRAYAGRRVVTAALGIVIPAVLAFLVISFIWS